MNKSVQKNSHTLQKMGENFCKSLKIKLPIIQAPMAGASTPELVAAVSNAGALGSLACGYLDAEVIRKNICEVRNLTDKPFAVNLFILQEHHASAIEIDEARKIITEASLELNFPIEKIKPPFAPSFEQQLQVIIEEKVELFSFTFGIPDTKDLAKLKMNDIKLLGTATTLSEAIWLERNGIDIIVAQGIEAGGHRGTFLPDEEEKQIGTFGLTLLLVDHIKKPIVAAGGIMDARGILSAFLLGASAVQMGTAFLSCKESGAHMHFKETLLKLTQDETVLTRAFSGKFARGLKNKFITRMQEHLNSILAYPIQNALTTEMRKEAAKQNSLDFMSLWAGQLAYLCHDLGASELIKKLDDDFQKIVNQFCNG